MSKQSYVERFKEISEKEACFEEAFGLLFEALDGMQGSMRRLIGSLNMDKSDLLVNAIVGCGAEYGMPPGMVQKHKVLMKKKHGEWVWDGDMLSKLSNNELMKIYTEDPAEVETAMGPGKIVLLNKPTGDNA